VEHSERRRADVLDSYWDAAQRGEAPQRGEVDVLTAVVIRHLGECPPTAELSAAQRRVRLRVTGLAKTTEDVTNPLTLSDPVPRGGAGGVRTSPIARPLWPSLADGTRWSLPHLATAVLLLVTLGFAAVTISLGRVHVDRLTGQPASIAGRDVTPSTGDSTIENLFATTLTADQVPQEGQLRFVLWRLSLAPGDGFPAWTQSQPCCPGPQFTHVVEGELTVEAAGPMEVVRGAGGTADVLRPAPGEEIVVGPGDTIVHDFAFPAAYAVRGTQPVQIVNAGLYAGTMPSPWLRHSGYLGGSAEALDSPLSAGPISVSILRVVLPPGGETRPPPSGSLVLETGANDANVGKRPDGSLFNLGDTTEAVYAVVLEPTGKPSLSR
jgi:hypothetical protein